MSGWGVVVAAGALGYGVKLAGWIVPPRAVSRRPVARIVGLLPIALLAALVVIQTLVNADGRPTLDARLPAVALAAVLAWRRVNFLVIVVAAAGTAAALRALGVG